ncbi:hypothetical protein [Bartonella massiliensis]|uniref:hypothetical protein n=1 Tax=Bartonella massiliensis TaxID=929795 RepID=UPI001AED1E6E|nr:hypothetical protein [Bartonella massiliensis]
MNILEVGLLGVFFEALNFVGGLVGARSWVVVYKRLQGGKFCPLGDLFKIRGLSSGGVAFCLAYFCKAVKA